ncbi:hypothetical protein SAMN06296386_106118 [Lachnospiraceae bacterium]|nr:hypothetical protein SAMN06296386_106118 [Lachnospiraceae bacterium]
MRKIRRKNPIIFILTIALTVMVTMPINAEEEDYRAYAHGISYVQNPVTEKSYLVWSDAYKKGIRSDGTWTHDVFMAKLNLKKPKIRSSKRLIKADEAQEPASASCTDDGNMIVTFEDGNDAGDNELYQRFAVYNKKMRPIVKYPADIAAGGHSGHAASTADHHIVFWCEGWIDEGGVDGLGTGDDVYVTSMDSDGENMKTIDVCKSVSTRDWWPLAAASHDKAMLVWQRYVEGQKYAHLCFSIYDPAGARLETVSNNETAVELKDMKLKYYSYNVVYLDKLRLFAVNLTTADDKGVLLLIDQSGKIVKKIENCAAFVREASPAVKTDGSVVTLFYPVNKKSIQSFSISSDLKVETALKDVDYEWTDCGTAGFIDEKERAVFASLDTAHFKKGRRTIKLIY